MKVALLVAFGALWLWAAASLPIIEDEAYYWTWSRDLSLTYFDHPPGIAWVMWASRSLFGDGPLGLRLPSALGILLIGVLTSWTAERLAPGSRTLACVVLLGSPMFVVGYIPGTPDVLLGAASAIAAFWVVRYPSGGLAAFILTASILVKHSAAVVALGTLLGVLSTVEGRAALGRPWPWLGLGLGVACTMPWVVADVRGGGSIAFQAEHVFDHAPARGPVAIPMVVGSMLLTLGPVGGALIWSSSLSAQGMARRALAGGALALLLACFVAVWAGSGEANWPMPALVFAAPLVAAHLAESPRVARVARPLLAASVIACALVLVHTAHPWIPFAVRRDPTLRGAGYEAIAAEADRQMHAHLGSVVVTRRYQSASLLRYHLRDRRAVLELGNKRRKSQYDVWPRPRACGVYVWVGSDPGPPGELGGEAISEATAVPRRMRPDGPVIDTWYVRSVRLARACGP